MYRDEKRKTMKIIMGSVAKGYGLKMPIKKRSN